MIVLPKVEALDSTFRENMLGHDKRARGPAGLAAQLDSDLDHVHRLDLKCKEESGKRKNRRELLTTAVAVHVERVPTRKFL